MDLSHFNCEMKEPLKFSYRASLTRYCSSLYRSPPLNWGKTSVSSTTTSPIGTSPFAVAGRGGVDADADAKCRPDDDDPRGWGTVGWLGSCRKFGETCGCCCSCCGCRCSCCCCRCGRGWSARLKSSSNPKPLNEKRLSYLCAEVTCSWTAHYWAVLL